jgi:CDP-diacylglycerol---glycerol-3-phosphate 3-phosphatidyltransferase
MTATATPPKKPRIFNLPNKLTASRLVLGVILFVLIEHEQWLWCIAVFALAAFSDWLDGFIARKQGITSTLGRNLDPLVDKVVICGAYIFLLKHPASGLTPWIIVIVVSRELIITGLRSFLENLGANFGAEWLGKLKMGLQCAALFAIFLALYDKHQFLVLGRDTTEFFDRLSTIFVWAMWIATALSGLQYLWKAFALLRKHD